MKTFKISYANGKTQQISCSNHHLAYHAARIIAVLMGTVATGIIRKEPKNGRIKNNNKRGH